MTEFYSVFPIMYIDIITRIVPLTEYDLMYFSFSIHLLCFIKEQTNKVFNYYYVTSF